MLQLTQPTINQIQKLNLKTNNGKYDTFSQQNKYQCSYQQLPL